MPRSARPVDKRPHLAERSGVQELQAKIQVRETLMTLLCQVVAYPDRIEIKASRGRLKELLAAQALEPRRQLRALERNSDDVLTLTAPARIKRVGGEMRMLVETPY